MTHILFIEDDAAVRESLARELVASGHKVDVAETGEAGFSAATRNSHQVVILDLELPDVSGEALLPKLLALSDAPAVVILTAHGSIDRAVRAMKDGAFDFLEKPCRLAELDAVLARAADSVGLRRENVGLRRLLGATDGVYLDAGLLTGDYSAQLDKMAGADLPVLVTGETGVGKEVVARWIHHRSNRKSDPFLVVDCAALQGSLIESELFGHEKGAFTGAQNQRPGLVDMAREGTLFLDEIGELDSSLQAKLLRLLETGEYRRVGGSDRLRSCARVIAATHRDLDGEIKDGRFRQDLFFRLNVLQIQVPSLRARRAEIRGLAQHFLAASTRRLELSSAAVSALESYDWPGNVRELRNVMERSAVLCDGDQIEVEDLPPEIRGGGFSPRARDQSLEEIERLHILKVLESVGGNRANAAAELQISQATLYSKLKKYRSV